MCDVREAMSSALPRCFLLPMLFAAVVASSAAAVGDTVRARPDDEQEEKPSIYLVSVHGEPPLAAAGVGRKATWYRAQKRRAARLHDRLLQGAMDDDGARGSGSCRCRKIYSFHHSVNGFAVHATASLAERLRAAPEVVAVEEDVGTRLMTTYTPRLLGLPDGVWRQRHRGSTSKGEDYGEGVVVGVVDSGVDPAHPSFAYVPRPPAAADPPDDDGPFAGGRECSVGPMFPPGSCNGKIVTARYFAAGAAAVLPLDPSRDLSPFDAEGHGNHVASVAAGNRGVPVVVDGAMYGFASGMAPSARLAVYKAVYPAGGTMADLIAAIDQVRRHYPALWITFGMLEIYCIKLASDISVSNENPSCQLAVRQPKTRWTCWYCPLDQMSVLPARSRSSACWMSLCCTQGEPAYSSLRPPATAGQPSLPSSPTARG